MKKTLLYLIIFLTSSSIAFGQETLTFDQPWGTNPWVENGLTWSFTGSWYYGGIDDYDSNNGTGHAQFRGENKSYLKFEEPLDLISAMIKWEWGEEAYIIGYAGDGVEIYREKIEEHYGYRLIELNWQNVYSISFDVPFEVEWFEDEEDEELGGWEDYFYYELYFDDLVYEKSEGCNDAYELSTIEVSYSSAKVEWRGQSGVSYKIRYKLTSESEWSYTDEIISNGGFNSYLLEDLESTSEYEWQIQTICDGVGGDFSLSENFDTGCEVSSVPVIQTSSQMICYGETITLEATGCETGTIVWNNGKEGKSISDTLYSGFTYWATCLEADGCESIISNEVVISVSNFIYPPIEPNPIILNEPGSTSLYAYCYGYDVKWYDSEVGGNLLFEDEWFNTGEISTTTNYWAACSDNDCDSERQMYKIIIAGSEYGDHEDLTFDNQPWGTKSWEENGLNWKFTGWDARLDNDYPYRGLGHAVISGPATSQLVFEESLDLKLIMVRWDEFWGEDATIFGYDYDGSIKYSKTIENTAGYESVELNWDNVYSISFDVPFEVDWFEDEEDEEYGGWEEYYYYELYFDDLVYEKSEVCNDAYELTTGEVSYSSAKAEWRGQTGVSYEIRYKLTSESEWSYTDEIISTGGFNSYLLENLESSSEYEWQIQTICDNVGGGYSASEYFETGCEVSSVPVIQTSSQMICYGETITLEATGCETGTIVWNNGKEGNSINETLYSDFIYSTVCLEADGCESIISNEVIISVPNDIWSPSIYSPVTIDAGESTTLYAYCYGFDVKWYDSEVGGNLLYEGGEFGTGIISTTTSYWVACSDNGCDSNREEYQVIIPGSEYGDYEVLTFDDQPLGIRSWEENGLQWEFTSWARFDNYYPFRGSGHAEISRSATSQLIFEEPLDLKLIMVKWNEFHEEASIIGYNSEDNEIYRKYIEEFPDYQQIDLGWDNVYSISFDVPYEEYWEEIDEESGGWQRDYYRLYFDDLVYSLNCKIVDNLSTQNISFSTATLQWEGQNNVSYKVAYKKDNQIEWSFSNTIISQGVSNSIVLDNLESNTMYVWQVITICENEVFSEIKNFETKCESSSIPSISTNIPSEVCFGEQLTLHASGCENGDILWNNGMTGNSIDIVVYSDYSFSAICIEGSCESDSSNEMQVTVHNISNVEISASKTEICIGEEVELEVIGCEDGTLVWNNELGDVRSLIVTPDEPVYYEVYCIQSNGCNSPKDEVFINVYPVPYIEAGVLDLCEQNPITLEAKGFGDNYLLQWFRNGEPIFGETNTTLSTNIPGNYSVATMKEGSKLNWIEQPLNIINVPGLNIGHFNLYEIQFTSENVGWIWWEYDILKTSDGGKSWEPIKVDLDSSDPLLNIQMITDEIGYACNIHYLYKTTDGGNNWSRILIDGLSLNIPVFNLGGSSPFYFIDQDNGWAIIEDQLYKTSTGGDSWSSIQLPNSLTSEEAFYNFVYFVNQDLGFVRDNYGFAIRTEDHGQTWGNYFPGSDRMKFTSEKIGYSDGYHLFKTTDKGATWEIIKETDLMSRYILVFDFINDDFGVIYDSEGSELTYDGGENWVEVEGPKIIINSIWLLDENNGWGVGPDKLVKLEKEKLIACVSESVEIINNIGSPFISANKSTICFGEEVNLTAVGCSTSSTVKWSTGDEGAVISITLNHDSYITAVCEENGCSGENSNEIVILVNEVEAIEIYSSATSICQGEEVELEVDGCYDGNLVWNNGLESSWYHSVEPQESITYQVYCEQTDGCVSPMVSVHINVLKPLNIISSNTDLCEESEITLSIEGYEEGMTVQWYKDEEKILGATGPTLIVTEIGAYTVAATKIGDDDMFAYFPINVINSEDSDDFQDFWFIDEEYGWLLGRESVYYTQNSGETWEKMDIEEGYITNFQMLNNQVGYLSNYDGLFKTTNGWANYNEVIPYNFDFDSDFKFYFLDESTGWILNRQEIYFTDNGGEDWELLDGVSLDKYEWYDNFYFGDKLIGFVSTDYGNVYKTTDGGNNWIEIVDVDNFDRIQFISELTGYLTRWNNLFKTSDGGITWMGVGLSFYGFEFADVDTGFGFYWDGAYHTNDGGNNWSFLESETSNWVTRLQIIDEQTVWALDQGNNSFLKMQKQRLASCRSEAVEIIKGINTPEIITQDQVICYGETITLVANGCGPTETYWSNGMLGSEITVSPESEEYYVAWCQDNSCVSEESNEVWIGVNHPDDVELSANTLSICEGGNEEVILMVDDYCGGTLIWTDGMAEGESERTVYPTETTTYGVYCQDDYAGCEGKVSSVTIGVSKKLAIVASAYDLCEESEITLSIEDYEEGTTVQWYKDGEKILGATSPTLTVTEIGAYTVAATTESEDDMFAYFPINVTNSEDSDSFKDFWFIDEENGWLLGEESVYYTNNGGETWEKKDIEEDYITNFQMLNNQIGYLSNYYGLFKTTDGWTSYDEINPDNFDFDFNFKFYFLDESTGWVLNHQEIYFTDNGGSDWVLLNSVSSNEWYENIHFKDNLIGFVSTDYRNVYKTSDGGSNWIKIEDVDDFERIQFVSELTGYLLNHYLFKTEDGGETWQNTWESFYSFDFLNENVGFAFDWIYAFRTENSGEVWGELGSEASNSIYKVQVIDEELVWALDWVNGNLLKLQKEQLPGCQSDVVEINKSINIPEITTQNQEICYGDTITLEAIGCGATETHWSNGMIGSEIIVSPEWDEYYVAWCQDNSCVSEESNGIWIDVKHPYNIELTTSTLSICEGENEEVVLTVNDYCGGTLIWTDGMGEGEWERTVTPTETTTYGVYCQDDDLSCDGKVSSVTIVVSKQLTINASSNDLCEESEVTLSLGNYEAGMTIQWFKNGEKILGAVNPTLTVSEPGDYTVATTSEGNELIFASRQINLTNAEDHEYYRAIQFVDEDNGWMLGEESVYFTSDGGKAWEKVELHFDYITDVNMFDNQKGYLSNYEGLYKTSDGWLTWEVVDNINFDFNFKFQFIAEDTGWVLNEKEIYFTSDGGQSWSSIADNLGLEEYEDFNNIYFSNNTLGFVSTDNGSVYKTSDGGNQWNKLSDIDSFDKIQFATEDFGYLLDNGDLYKSNDGGSTWEYHNRYFNDFNFIDENLGFGTEWIYVYKTEDGGETWTYIDSEAISTINSIQIVNESTVFALDRSNKSLLRLQKQPLPGCQSNPATIFKGIDTPEMLSVETTICYGEEITLETSGCGTAITQWSNGMTGSSITFKPDWSDYYYAWCENDGCESEPSEGLWINVNDFEIVELIASSSNLCFGNGEEITLTVSGSCDGTLIWTDGSSQGEWIRTVSPDQSTVYSVYCHNQ